MCNINFHKLLTNLHKPRHQFSDKERIKKGKDMES